MKRYERSPHGMIESDAGRWVDASDPIIAAMLEALRDSADQLHGVCRRLEIERQEAQDRGDQTYILGAAHDGLWKALEAARAAIAKAEGRQS